MAEILDSWNVVNVNFAKIAKTARRVSNSTVPQLEIPELNEALRPATPKPKHYDPRFKIEDYWRNSLEHYMLRDDSYCQSENAHSGHCKNYATVESDDGKFRCAYCDQGFNG